MYAIIPFSLKVKYLHNSWDRRIMNKLTENEANKISEKLRLKYGMSKNSFEVERLALDSEKLKLKQQVEILNSTEDLDFREVEIFLSLIAHYFSKGRPKYFAEFEKIMTPRFAEIIERIEFEQLTTITNHYHQLAKTAKRVGYDDTRQKYISAQIPGPFVRRLEKIQKNDPISQLSYEINPNNVMILTRHALTKGTYAPGKQIFAIANSLVKKGKNVEVISLGSIDKSFIKLMNENSNFQVYEQKYGGADNTSQFLEMRDKINEFKPAVIFTEVEVSILVAIEMYQLPSPIFLVSAGFYRVPWYSGILVTPELRKQIGNEKTDRPIFNIPQTHLPESLAPYCDPVILTKTKAELNITSRFVIASFARYELFSDDFLILAQTILRSIPNTALILAGSNDQTSAKEFLKDFIADGRVKLLGVSDISVAGYCCDVFLDTFPIPTGFAALESMAKGKPVFSMDCDLLKFYGASRVKHLIFKSQKQLLISLFNAVSDSVYYDEISTESLNFIENNFYDLSKLSDALVKVIK